MTTYLVRLNGRNFLMDGDGGTVKKRFVATRLVEAENPKQAETLARDLIRNHSALKNSVLNDVSDPPIINLESVSEVSAMAYDAQNRAHSIFWEDEDTENDEEWFAKKRSLQGLKRHRGISHPPHPAMLQAHVSWLYPGRPGPAILNHSTHHQRQRFG